MSTSFHDVSESNQESFYHGFLLGITLGLRSRYDLALYPKDTQKDPGILIEVGLKQIEEKAYYQDLQTHGCSKINGYSSL